MPEGIPFKRQPPSLSLWRTTHVQNCYKDRSVSLISTCGASDCRSRPTAQSVFGAQEIVSAFLDKQQSAHLQDISTLKSIDGTQIVLTDLANQSRMDLPARSTDVKPGTLRQEGFSIRVTRKGGNFTIWVIGADPAGTMYGGLELAEIIRIAGLEAAKNMD
ncbi:hypothetical protein AMJ86_02585, partial [bacterium SM23_57]